MPLLFRECLSSILPACLQLYVFVCMFRAVYPFCLCVLVHVHMERVARRLGCLHGRQVRHVAGTGRFLEQPHLSVTLDR